MDEDYVLVCPNCDCTDMIIGWTDEDEDEDDGTPIYRVGCMCKNCGAQLEFKNGECIDNYTIEQAEKDMWK